MSVELALVRAYAEAHPNEFARTLVAAEPRASAAALESLKPAAAARALRSLSPQSTAALLRRCSADAASAILSRMAPDLAVLIARSIPSDERAELLAGMERRQSAAIAALLEFSAGSVAGLADPMALTLGVEDRVDEALERVRGADRAAMYYLYVLAEEARLVGVVTLRELLQAEGAAAVSTLMCGEVEALIADMGRQSLLSHRGWQRFHTLPVVDRQGRFLGVIRHETLRHTERNLRERNDDADLVMTAGALAEVFSAGALALVEWVARVGAPPTRGGPR